MFNYFESLKNEFKIKNSSARSFNLVLMGDDLLYIEGHKGLLKLSTENVSFKVKGGVIIVLGKNLQLKELTPSTVAITGKIKTFEVM